MAAAPKIHLSDDVLELFSQIDPELEHFLNSQPALPDPPFTDLEQCRALTELADVNALKQLGEPSESLEELSFLIPISSDHTTRATVVKPSGDTAGPLIVLLHPSGFFLPGISKIISLSRKLASLLSATVVAPAYRLAPEHPFPAAVDDTWAVVQWVAKNNATLGADLTKGFIIGGISSGANLAVVLTRRAVEFGISPPVTGAWAPLFMAFNNKDDIPERYRHLWRSRTQNKDALVIDSTKAEVMFGYYKPDSASPLFNPLAGANAGGFNLGRMPRIHLQIAGADLFRDDGVILAYALQESGVPVKIDIYPGMPHSFWLFAPELEASKRCMRDIIAGFAWLLDVELDSLPPGWQELSLIGCRIHNSAASQTE